MGPGGEGGRHSGGLILVKLSHLLGEGSQGASGDRTRKMRIGLPNVGQSCRASPVERYPDAPCFAASSKINARPGVRLALADARIRMRKSPFQDPQHVLHSAGMESAWHF